MRVSTPTKEQFETLHAPIQTYQQTRSEEILASLWEQVSLYVRGFPRLAFRQSNEDVMADFYLYMMERKATLFEKFDPQLASFKSYLSLRLKSHYINFIKRENSKQKLTVSYTDEEYPFQESKNEFDERIADVNVASTKSSSHENTYQEWFPDYRIDPLKYLCVKLYYLDFFNEEDFVRLQEYTGKSYTQLLEDFDELNSIITHKKIEQLKLDERLNGLLQNLITLSKEHSQKSVSASDTAKLMEELSAKRTRLISEYYRISVFSPIRNLAQILGQKETKVANILGYQRKVMEKRIAKLLETPKQQEQDS